ncbi:MAG: hypothetical protein HY924_10915 [Elusimicrobia bacterium]|nr:hypothetical protein [Elusimicrobiota bacterium]
MMPALSFLGLVHPDGRPTEDLKGLVAGSEEIQKKTLRTILEKKYPGAVRALAGGTPITLKRDFGYDPADGVKNRCIRFFTAAAKECGLSISSLILNKSGVRRPKKAGSNRKATAERHPHRNPSNPATGEVVHGGESNIPGLKQVPIPVGTSSGLVLWSIGVPASGYESSDVETFLAVVRTALLNK